MEVLQVKKYNALQEIKYDKACHEWDSAKGGFPQAAFYFFSTSFGTFRQTGYVAFGGQKSVWRPTKKEAILAWLS